MATYPEELAQDAACQSHTGRLTGLWFLLNRPKGWILELINYTLLLRVKEQRNILHEIRKRKANWIGHILHRNCLLQRVIEGEIKGGIEVTGRRGRRRRKLLNDLQERRGYSHLKEEALDRTMWRARFGRGFGPVVRQTTKWMNEYYTLTLCYVDLDTQIRCAVDVSECASVSA